MIKKDLFSEKTENVKVTKNGYVRPMNLQLFAEKDDESEDDADDDVDDDDDEPDDNDDEESKKSAKKSGNSKGAKTFSQEQVTRMMTKEKHQGRAAALRELGIDPKDAKSIKMIQAFVNSQKTDEQIETEKKNEENAKLAEAEQKAMIAETKAEAMMLGVKKQFVDDVVTLVVSKMSDDTDVKTLLGELKTKYPVWFGDDNDDEEETEKKKKTGQKGTGSSVQQKGKKKEKEEGLGARLAAKRNSGKAKKSYWS